VKRIACALLAISFAGCTTPLATGERLYREGDRLAALETWRAISEDNPGYEKAHERIAVVEEEFQQLVVRYKQRARYFEAKNRLAESIVNYRLALKLQPDDAETLAHVQELARAVVRERRTLRAQYREDFEAGYLAKAGASLEQLRILDPFDPALQADERELSEGLQESVTHLLAVGRRGFSDGNHAAAERAFRSVLAVDPNNESARGYLSYIETIRRASQTAGNEPAAFEPPETFASDAEIRAEGFHQNALAAEAAGDYFVAIRHDLQALHAYSDHDGARRHLTQTRRELAPQVEILIEEGRTHFRDEDLQSALDSWRRALLVDPKNERAQAYAARAVRQLGNLERLRSEPDVASGDR
jgi:tetratricopeptide (TPR) repeat protein